MKRIVVELTGMPFDPTYEIDGTSASPGPPEEVQA